ncbi:helix-turn-helix domain-containing protein [Rhizobium leguminosarum]|uniref:helix-turn-helix domain-containing protein n=1 Tax=Rhizobium leguminosarum TaxID=384 RepID=UPI00161D97E3|nr:helix-turn-helix domain-containing protein [Rhizobium leguminosarum]MBB4339521.1 putative transcriptional regulator [Rhizobium leguminosarum]MBB6291768.1 putative transcriptional regulator [Rhizobium leguminosarum]
MRNFTASKLDLLDRMSADHRLSATDFRVAYRVFSYMDAHSGACFPRQETIAADLGVTDRTVRNSLINLRACGWLEIEERALPKGRGKSNFYRFQDATKGSTVPVNNTITGNVLPVNGATTGSLEPDFRKRDSGAPNKEHVEDNTLYRGEARERTINPERGTRLPENFSPDRSIALAEGMTAEEAQRSALNFIDYWKAKPGAAGRKLDWGAAWRIWARKDAAKAERNWPDRQQRSNGNGSKPKQQDWAAFLKNESEAHQRKGDAAHGAEPWIRPRLPPGNTR